MSVKSRLALLAGLCVFLLVTLLGVGVAQANAAPISGTVTDSTMTVAVSNVEIDLCDAAGTYLQSVFTNPSGVYSFTGIAPGSYLVHTSVSYQNYINEWYPNVHYQGNWAGTGAGTVSVSASDVSGIDFALPQGQTISGTLKDADTNAAISDGVVRLYDATGHYQNIDANTNPSGAYSLVGIVPGVYKVGTWSSFLNYIDQWYDGGTYQDNSAGTGAGTVDVSTSGQSGIDFALHKGHSISGTVTDASTHSPIPGLVLISATDATGWKATVAVDNTNGAYIIGGLLPGPYKLSSWNDQNYIDQWYQNIPSEGNPSGLGATPVTLSASDVGGINFALVLKTPTTMLLVLRAFIAAPTLGKIGPGMSKVLSASVNVAQLALRSGRPLGSKAAVVDLRVLIGLVRAQTGKTVSSDAAKEIIKQANAIIAAISM